jgi:putative flippase GtrA
LILRSSISQLLGSSSGFSQFLRFAIVGASGTAVHFAILIALVEGWGINPVAATTIGFIIAATLGYVLHHYFTFRASQRLGRGIAGYYATVTVGLILNALVVAALINWHMPYILAQVAGSGVTLLWNFAFSRTFVFRAH